MVHSASITNLNEQPSLLNKYQVTGQAPLIGTRFIRSSTLFEVSVKCFPIIFQSFHV